MNMLTEGDYKFQFFVEITSWTSEEGRAIQFYEKEFIQRR